MNVTFQLYDILKLWKDKKDQWLPGIERRRNEQAEQQGFCSTVQTILYSTIKMDCCCCHCLVTKSCQLFATPWTAAHLAPLSVYFPSKNQYWGGLQFPSPGDLPNPGIKPMSPTLVGGFFTMETPGKPL